MEAPATKYEESDCSHEMGAVCAEGGAVYRCAWVVGVCYMYQGDGDGCGVAGESTGRSSKQQPLMSVEKHWY